jgi:DNA polymerase V
MFALVDAAGFYASCEKVIDIKLRDRPVIVLSNNDGCVVAACPIAKKLGAPKFEPYFKVKDFVRKNKVVVRSSNYELYGDLSDRFMKCAHQFAPEQYIYSIDECFLDLHRCNISNWIEYGWKIRRTIWQETKIPVCVGIAPTLTLAKAGNFASKNIKGCNGVMAISTPETRKQVLQIMPVEKVWGIGRQLTKHLNLLGIETAWDLANQPTKRMRREFNVNVERTVRELNGKPCLVWDQQRATKKEIFSTRSTGKRITRLNELKQALAFHANIVTRKARKQNTAIKELVVFAQNSPHDKNSDYYSRSGLHQFIIATTDTTQVSAAATALAKQIFDSNVRFYRVGVGAIRLEPKLPLQNDLFRENEDKIELMECLDEINSLWGMDTIHLAAQGITKSFAMKRELLSPQYTTRWKHLPQIKCR